MSDKMREIIETPGYYEMLASKGGCFVVIGEFCGNSVNEYLLTDPAGRRFLEDKGVLKVEE